MSDTPSSPSTSGLGCVLGADGERLYVVGTRKYAVRRIATAGLYASYWFRRNSRDVRDRDGEDLWPIPSALFWILIRLGFAALFAGEPF